MKKGRYYVDGKEINIDEWEIEWYRFMKIQDYDEPFRDDAEYITCEHGKQLGVGWKL